MEDTRRKLPNLQINTPLVDSFWMHFRKLFYIRVGAAFMLHFAKKVIKIIEAAIATYFLGNARILL